ncbi:MAG: hypothetical protein KDD99_19735, partial [Bacteroidetes bacterium]|nr:hypothetical protein [Bacteroidota bacterium]
VVKKNLQQQEKVRNKTDKWLSKLSAVPASFRKDEPLFISSQNFNPESLKRSQETAIQKGVQKISRQTNNNLLRPPGAILRLTPDQISQVVEGFTPDMLERLNALEALENIEINYGTYCRLKYAKQGGTFLERKVNLLDARNKRDAIIEKLRQIEAGGGIVNPGNDGSPTPVILPHTPWDGTEPMEEYVKRLVLNQVRELSSENDVIILDDSSQDHQAEIQSIRTTLEDLTPPKGPADAIAFYHFHTLQMAMPNIWTEAFDGRVHGIIGEIFNEYENINQVYSEAGEDIFERLSDTRFSEEALFDLKEFTDLMGQMGTDVLGIGAQEMPGDVRVLLDLAGDSFDTQSNEKYALLSLEQQNALNQLAFEYQVLVDRKAELITLYNEQKTNKDNEPDDFGIKGFLKTKFENTELDIEQLGPLKELYAAFSQNSGSGNDGNQSTNSSAENLLQEVHLQISELVVRGKQIYHNPEGKHTRIQRLIAELTERLKAPHSFTVFAENSYNFGIITTMEQKWIPGDYQATNLISTLTLAPGEKRTYSKKEVRKKSVARKEMEKNSSTLSDERTFSSKASSDIMDKVSKTTNFSIQNQNTVGGDILGFRIDNTLNTDFKSDQQTEFTNNRKAIREATKKATQEYKNERSLEINTQSDREFELGIKSEISNPNNEITVTYLFYELERQYRITEYLKSVRPVIMIAQKVPQPHEIDEEWVLSYEWIIRRNLLDRSFMDALDFISEGLVGDEVSLEILRENHETQKALVEELSTTMSTLTQMQDSLREALIQTAEQEKLAEVAAERRKKKRRRGFLKKIFNPAGAIADRIASGRTGLTLGEGDPELLEARREAMETRLEYLESNLEDYKSQLTTANNSLTQASKDLEIAIKDSFTRKSLVSQLLIHLKDNILLYMQAIWSQENEHQRYMRLWNVDIDIPMPGPDPSGGEEIRSEASIRPAEGSIHEMIGAAISTYPLYSIMLDMDAAEMHTQSKKLHEIADIDHPIGFKGNYMIFPLKECTYITDYMMQDYVDEYLGVRAPDPASEYSTDELLKLAESLWHNPDTTAAERETLRNMILDRLNSPVLDDELVVIPTGQLFIEALKGSHALLEDFKLKHRKMDMLKVKEEVRAAQLENLRKALRLVQEGGAILDDPEVDKKIVVEGNGMVNVGE